MEGIVRNLRGQGKLTEKNIDDSLRQVRRALLEADVNFKVARTFIDLVKEKALGQGVLRNLSPGQQMVGVVHRELVSLMGGEAAEVAFAETSPTIVMLVGLQGSGKTTATGKLARYFLDAGRRPMLAAADVYRPAAVKQLQVLGEQLDAPVVSLGDGRSPEAICRVAVDRAGQEDCDVVILDTAGRLHVDEEMMDELCGIRGAVHPHEILLVVDGMTGQDAVNVAEAFDRRLDIDGCILTKMDGDARGGAALSIRQITRKPIKFVGVGEKLDAPGDFPSRTDGLPDPGHGRRGLPGRTRAGLHRRGGSAQARNETAQADFRSRGFPVAAPATWENGLHAGTGGDDARFQQEGVEGYGHG